MDDHILKIADKKIGGKGLGILLKRYDGEALQFLTSQRFDKMVSTLVFHHILTLGKRKILNQLFQIIKPGGELHIADFGKARNIYSRLATELLRSFDGFENTRINAEGLLPQVISESGFNDVKILSHQNTAFCNGHADWRN